MSHFVVMVTRTDEDSVESQLEPFYEQGNENDSFMEKEYYLKNDEKEIEEWLDSEIKSFNEHLNNPDVSVDNKRWCQNCLKDLERIKNLKTVRGKLKAIKRHEGGGLDKDGLYWLNNPNAQWDWWSIGGRWDGWLVDKNGIHCNICTVKDLDFDRMREAEKESRARYYDQEMKKKEEKPEYKPLFWDFDHIPTREEYINKELSVAPYAFLHDGEWVERGEMGWWGISNDKFSAEEWDKKFEEFIKSLDPETEITIVDCHI